MSRTGTPSALACVAEIRALGNSGPTADTIMLDNSVILGVQPSNRADRVRLTYIWVSKSVRGQGHGTRALEAILSIVDRHALAILVRPAAFDRHYGSVMAGPPNKVLTSWYARHGFRPFSGPHMLREPRRNGEQHGQ